MFLPLSEKVDNQLILDSYDKIKEDYLNFLGDYQKYFFDYQHSLNLNFNISRGFTLPKNTGYFWQVCPLIYGRHPVPGMIFHKEVEECFTTKMIMSFKIRPILAIFSVLEPNGIVDPHSDYDDELMAAFDGIRKPGETVVKYHLSLDIPDDGPCGLKVGGEERVLKNRELNPFDERSTHSAYNKSSKRRGALIMSFARSEIY